ncbi:MAG: DUF4156 domain-containing protein [Nitrosomonas sp.]|nr:DUF4156 domain-containing protein [Nitrosomonas sp.]
MKRILVVVCGSLLLFSCTWVKVTSNGESVRLVRSAEKVEPCKKIGDVNTQVVSKIIFERNEEKVAGELADLARNEAALLGGDTIIPVSEVNEGRRSFDVYQCFPTASK